MSDLLTGFTFGPGQSRIVSVKIYRIVIGIRFRSGELCPGRFQTVGEVEVEGGIEVESVQEREKVGQYVSRE